MLIYEFNSLTGLNIKDQDAYKKVEEIYNHVEEDKFKFCKSLMADYLPFSQMQICKKATQENILNFFLDKIGYCYHPELFENVEEL